jgi:hypothetical protein
MRCVTVCAENLTVFRLTAKGRILRFAPYNIMQDSIAPTVLLIRPQTASACLSEAACLSAAALDTAEH